MLAIKPSSRNLPNFPTLIPRARHRVFVLFRATARGIVSPRRSIGFRNTYFYANSIRSISLLQRAETPRYIRRETQSAIRGNSGARSCVHPHPFFVTCLRVATRESTPVQGTIEYSLLYRKNPRIDYVVLSSSLYRGTRLAAESQIAAS